MIKILHCNYFNCCYPVQFLVGLQLPLCYLIVPFTSKDVACDYYFQMTVANVTQPIWLQIDHKYLQWMLCKILLWHSFCQTGFVYKGIRRIEINEYGDYIILANTKYSNIGVNKNEVIHFVDDILFNENFVIVSFL